MLRANQKKPMPTKQNPDLIDKSKWTLLAQPQGSGHRFFRNADSGQLAIASDDDRNPTIVDTQRAIEIFVDTGKIISISLPLSGIFDLTTSISVPDLVWLLDNKVWEPSRVVTDRSHFLPLLQLCSFLPFGQRR